MRCTGSDRSPALMRKIESDAAELRRCLDGFPARQIGGRARRQRASQVDLRYATRSDHQTTLAFVRTVGSEPQYAFYDVGTASRNWVYRRGSILFDEIEAVHVGSTTLADDQGAAQALAMVEDARGTVTISFDPNCRPKLVMHKTRYVERMNAFAGVADIVRMSDVDFEFLYGGGDYAGRAKSFIEAGASLVVVTHGIKGAQAWHKEAGAVDAPAPVVDVVDTRRAWSRVVICFQLRVLHMWAHRRRSSVAIRCWRGIVSSFAG